MKFDDETIRAIFGHEAAEDEEPKRLKQYYFKNNTFERISADLDLRILVGHKGTGKSALFRVAMAEDEQKGVLPILIRPDDVTTIQTNSNDLLNSIRQWKEGLIKILYEKSIRTFGVPQSAESPNFQIIGKAVHFVTDLLEPTVKKYMNTNKLQEVTFDTFIKNNLVNVYLDDLDRGWSASKESILRLSALLNALRDLIKDFKGLHFKVALRSDVYYLVRTSDESTDKIEGSVVWHTWTNHEILGMLVKRIESYFGKDVGENELMSMQQKALAGSLNSVIEPIFSGSGKWEYAPTYRILMSLIRKRPRDLVKLCTLAAQQAHQRNSHLIQTQDLRAVFEQYSQGRLQDTENEYRSELPEIQRLLIGMRPNRRQRFNLEEFKYNHSQLIQKMEAIQQEGKFVFFGGKIATSDDLASFLYKVNFLTACKQLPTGKIERKYFEENKYLQPSIADFGFEWEVHPAYRWALQPANINELLNNIAIEND